MESDQTRNAGCPPHPPWKCSGERWIAAAQPVPLWRYKERRLRFRVRPAYQADCQLHCAGNLHKLAATFFLFSQFWCLGGHQAITANKGRWLQSATQACPTASQLQLLLSSWPFNNWRRVIINNSVHRRDLCDDDGGGGDDALPFADWPLTSHLLQNGEWLSGFAWHPTAKNCFVTLGSSHSFQVCFIAFEFSYVSCSPGWSSVHKHMSWYLDTAVWPSWLL